MPTRDRACAWVVAASLLAPSAASGQERTIQEVVELIVAGGPQARAIRSAVEVMRSTQHARLAYPNPTFIYSREGAGFTEFFQLQQTLPFFGTRATLERAGVAATAAAEADRDAQLWALRSEAAAAVARLVSEEVRLESRRELVREVERLLEILRTREREGEGSRFDRIRAEHELEATRQQETATAIAVAEARAAVAAMLPPDVVLARVSDAADPEEPPPASETLVADALRARADVRALQQSVRRADEEVEAARLARRPLPTVFGGVKRADTVKPRVVGSVFGVNVPLPLFDNGNREAAGWIAERERLNAERMSVETRIRIEVVAARAALVLRQRALSQGAASETVQLTQIAEVAYREGEIGVLELLDAARAAAEMRRLRTDAHLSARLAQIALERAVGEPLWP